jgi:hypothetical protein
MTRPLNRSRTHLTLVERGVKEAREIVLGPGRAVQSPHRFWLYGGFSVFIILMLAWARHVARA